VNLLAFFPRQLRDHLVTRGAAIFVIGLMMLLPVFLTDVSGRPMEPDWRVVLTNVLGGAAGFGVLVATYGLLGEDVRRGYFRILFAKPVSPVWFYAQSLVGAGLAYLAALVAVIGVFAVFRTPVWPGRELAEFALFFLLVGSIVFGLSRVTRLDWVFGFTMWITGDLVRNVPATESLRWKIANVILPPTHLVEGGVLTAQGIDWGAMLWVVSYAGLWIVAGLTAVRLLPLGSAR
jgi:hypothetical protein